MTVLVAYGSRTGSTAEIAEWIADELKQAGCVADMRPAADVDDVAEYEAVVLGAAVYANGWHGDARKFAHRFAGQLAGRPVWLFSSGPLDTSADDGDLPPSPQARSAMHALGARAHATFGGRLNDEAKGWLGFLVRRMKREDGAGDFRNPARVRAWAREIAAEIQSPTAA